MEQNADKTKVMFRKFSDGEIIALFPELFEKNDCCLSYMHIGQHSAASYELVHDTELANETEYKPLYDELETLGYNLQVCKRLTEKMKTNAYQAYLQSWLKSLPKAC